MREVGREVSMFQYDFGKNSKISAFSAETYVIYEETHIILCDFEAIFS